MAVLTDLPEDSAATAGLAELLAWRLPAADTSPARVAAMRAETDLLGLTAGGALSALGRGLVAGQAEQTARAMLPVAASTVALQDDLTAVSGRPVVAQTAATLDRLAEPTGQGRWRFTRDSVRRALDDGHRSDEILAAMESVAETGVPQSLADLVGDLARVHGQIRVADCGCCVIADDPQVINEIIALKKPGLRRVAPPAARQAGPGTTAARLHTAPLPAGQQVQVLIDRLRDAAGGYGVNRLSDDEMRLLAEATEHGTAVWIKHESRYSTRGKTTWKLLDELHIEPRQVMAWCHTRQKQDSFPLSLITSVEPA